MNTRTVGWSHRVSSRVLGSAIAVCVVIGLPRVSSAQVRADTADVPGARGAEDPRTQGRWGCLHGVPPECASLWLVELQASTPLVRPSYERGDDGFRYRIDAAENQYEWNVGHLIAVGSDWAVGGTATLGTGADDVFTGLRGRARRWVSDVVSVELEMGLARSNGSHAWLEDQTGWSTGVRLNIQDFGAAFVRYDVYGAPDARSYPGSIVPPINGSQHIVRGGVGLGGGVALAGTGVVLVAYAVLIGLFLGSGGWT
ncbi:MAG: hypothetical protein KJO11_11265 [Gemmatimonadetes bacterium]|nr:hypothetical protein [Gemmatimonadota bacterium]MBT8404556.1 hypothetical protein [Gemmatimonadota bacterium]NNF37665.1 hypothetical protein [Gemmatimonadota bacterium]NNK62806.1 hypothetical protein [Gemmatimonadota bacterium]